MTDATSFYEFVLEWSNVAKRLRCAERGEQGQGDGFDRVDVRAPSFAWDRNWVFPIDQGSTKKTTAAKLRIKGKVHKEDFSDDMLTSKLLLGHIIPRVMKKAADPGRPPSRLAIHFPGAELQSLKKKAQEQGGPAVTQLTTNDVLCAHLVQCLSDYLSFEGKTAIHFAIQMRMRLPVAGASAREKTGGKQTLRSQHACPSLIESDSNALAPLSRA